MTNYIDRIAKEIGDRCDCDMVGETKELLRFYALLCLSTGMATTSRNVHDAWAAWCAAESPKHPSLVPFEMLSPEMRALDEKYRDAIFDVAETLR